VRELLTQSPVVVDGDDGRGGRVAFTGDSLCNDARIATLVPVNLIDARPRGARS